ncbi:MAG TPA: phage tail tape measure protein, partial [Phycisphaerales bacterium]|nr:phage tail tape measure protein [Phycisphaerales bacterium]
MATLRLAIDASRLVHEAQRAKAALHGVQTGATGAFNAVKRSADLVLAPLKLVTGALVTVKASMLALGTASIQAGAQFQQQMAMVSTMLDETSMGLLSKYEAGLRDLKARYGESTATLSKGLYDILSASIDTARALEVLEVATVAARAGLTDTGTAADAITTILNAYQLSADKAGRVSDLLFAIVKRGKTTFPELAPNIGKVASAAAVAGLSLEELGAALATMTRAGVQTDIAITALRAILTTFLSPTDEARAAARALGFELSSTTLQAEGLLGVLRKLTDATPEQVAAIMPNVRGFIGFAAALKQVEGNAADLDFMLRAGGRTMEAYRKMTNTLTHEWTLFKAAVGGIRTAFAAGFLDETRLVVRDLTQGAKMVMAAAVEAGRAFGQELERGRAAILAAVDVAAEIGAQMRKAFEIGQG